MKNSTLKKKFLNLPQQLDKKPKFSGVWIGCWGVSPGHPGQLLSLIFDILKRKIQNLPVLPLKTCAQKNPPNCWFTSLDQPRGSRLCKKKTFSSQVPSGYLILHMKWPGEAIWLILLPKNQTETKKFHFHFSQLPWDHCVLTKKSFWIVQMDFLDLIFHLKSLSDYRGKIPVLVKNQGTFYLK